MHDLTENIIDDKTTAVEKAIASRVPRKIHKDWHSIKVWVMKYILHAKACSWFSFS